MRARQIIKGSVWMSLILLWVGTPLGYSADKEEFETLEQKVGYVIGCQMAGNLKRQGVPLDIEAFIKGAREALNGQTCVFDPNEQQTIINALRDKMQKEQQAKQKAAMGESAWKTKLTKPELMTFDDQKDYFWILETNKGKITIKLMPDIAPMHVTSTIFLTNKGFYNDIGFHRVIPGFMAQGGCPLGNGRGGPGYSYDGEFDPSVKHDKPYLLSMANAGPGTDGSQFFITFKPTPNLDNRHTVFGAVVDGKDVVDKLEAAGNPNPQANGVPPLEKLVINKATIEEKVKE